MDANRYGPTVQRNALAPGLLAVLALIAGVLLMTTEWFELIRYVVAILALIVGWFAVQAKHWWWVPVFLAIAVAWNPVLPFDAGGLFWIIGHGLAAVSFFVAGLLITVPRDPRA